MAWQNITHACGHEDRHQLYGKHDDRDAKANWLAKSLCSECYKAEKTAEADAASVGLPELTGTPKQVAWSKTVRVDVLARIDEAIARFAGRAHAAANAELFNATLATLRDVRTETAANPAARFWIDNRDLVAEDFLATALKTRGAL